MRRTLHQFDVNAMRSARKHFTTTQVVVVVVVFMNHRRSTTKTMWGRCRNIIPVVAFPFEYISHFIIFLFYFILIFLFSFRLRRDSLCWNRLKTDRERVLRICYFACKCKCSALHPFRLCGQSETNERRNSSRFDLCKWTASRTNDARMEERGKKNNGCEEVWRKCIHK